MSRLYLITVPENDDAPQVFRADARTKVTALTEAQELANKRDERVVLAELIETLYPEGDDV